jgi:hypothetical protein
MLRKIIVKSFNFFEKKKNPSGIAALEILCELHPDYVKIDRNDILDSYEKEEDFLLAEIEGSRY